MAAQPYCCTPPAAQRGVKEMRSRSFPWKSALYTTLAFAAAFWFVDSPARERSAPLPAGEGRDPIGILVLDGSGVHDVGELHMHTGNWGAFGSYPSANMPISEYPSAEWPAGSGVEHLYIAGLWVGGRRGCVFGEEVIGVSTAAYDMELRPTTEPVDRIYETQEDAPGGNRIPSPYADDDGDGKVDEDPLDGRDNDGDGFIDEDFAAISDQMFSSWYTDDQPEAITAYPEHTPLGIKVRQESYQWTDPRFDDFVGVRFEITTADPEADCVLGCYLGMFLDFDIGYEDDEQYWGDDAAGYWEGIRCTELGPASLRIAYMYNAGEEGPTSYIGAMILGHTTNADASNAPARVGVRSFRVFSGDQPYENGGDPVNDFQRYEVMSSSRIDRNRSVPRDYRMLMSAGPFDLYSGDSIELDVGFVCGATLEEMLGNAALCQKLFDGLWLNLDGNPMTGIDRRETLIEGPAEGVVIDPCRDELSDPISLASGEHAWINDDCAVEEMLKEACGYTEADSLLFRTGVAGREANVRWLYERPQEVRADLDIRPGSCPNPFNVKLFDFLDGNSRRAGGVFPAAVCGSAEFDVRDIDLETVRLEGVEPLETGLCFEDVTSPASEDAPCVCARTGPDGYEDLVLRFRSQSIAEALLRSGRPRAGEKAMLFLTGQLGDGRPFEAADCIFYVGPPPEADGGGRDMLTAERTRLLGASPNPFNPATTIRFELASPGPVTLAVYDVGGRLVRLLVDHDMEAGRHEAVWDGRAAGGAAAASGVYFYRLETPAFSGTRKMVLLR